MSVLTSVGAVYNVWASKRNDWWKNRENIAVGPWLIISETPPKQQMVLQGSQQKHVGFGSQKGHKGDPLRKTSVVFDHALLGAN